MINFSVVYKTHGSAVKVWETVSLHSVLSPLASSHQGRKPE